MSAERKRAATAAELGDKSRMIMGHNKKKKSKLNSTARTRNSDPSEPDVRRSLRRRNVRYLFDLDDYFDEDDIFEEDQRRREKKLNHLLNLQTGQLRSATTTTTTAPGFSQSSSDGPSHKRRKIIDEIDEDDGPNHDENYSEGNDQEITRKKPLRRGEDSNPVTASNSLQGQPLPDKKTLELILDKLQKKDTYGVYAEPVDPEELPDYHDVIKHPMAFSTVRKKLGNGSYATLEQFEDDVFLICANAMEYNAPDTIYHKQARSIKELATRKFEKLRLKDEGADKYVKPEQKLTSTPIVKKQIHGSVIRTQESSVSNLASSSMCVAVDLRSVSNASQNVESEKPGNTDILGDGNYLFHENGLDKGDESLSGKGMMSRFGKKSPMPDKSRRETYDISLACNVGCSWSMFSSSDGESKQLIPVGLYTEHSYARSLARFAAALGSVVWEISSKRIEQALPQGLEFGRGWVGEYEPLPTPVLIYENFSIKEPPFFTKAAEPKKRDDNPASVSLQENLDYASLPFFYRAGDTFCSTSGFPGRIPSTRVNASDMSSLFLSAGMKASCGSANTSHQHHISELRASADTEQKASRHFRQGGSQLFHQNAAESMNPRQNPSSTETESPEVKEFASRQGSFSVAENLKQPYHGTVITALPNGRVLGSRLDVENVSSPANSKARASGYYQQGVGQLLNDPVHAIAAKGQNQWSANSTLSSAPLLSSNGPMITASTVAACASIPVGTVGFRPPSGIRNTPVNQISVNSPREGPQFLGELASTRGKTAQLDRNDSLLHAFVPEGPVLNGAHFHKPPINYPQLAGDLSRFQLQSTWRSISPQMHHPKQKQESLPPDLNIGFQSAGSAGGPSTGVLVDPQQPDLALQL